MSEFVLIVGVCCLVGLFTVIIRAINNFKPDLSNEDYIKVH